MKSILIIQTAFIGDVVLATPVIEKLHETFPKASIDFLLRKGNEGLLVGHPYLREVLIWDKKKGKYKQLFAIIGRIRRNRYDCVINLHRFLNTGLITVFSGAKETIGFSKNPLSFAFSKKYPHFIGEEQENIHEIDRNLSLISHLHCNTDRRLPKLYPSLNDFEKVKKDEPYVTISPTSVWFTKQYPLEKWVEVINLIHPTTSVFLLGGKPDVSACEQIKNQTKHNKVEVMAGKLSFLESAALMKGATMNYVNDSAPMHFASAMDAPVTVIYCSTIPAFGFGPLSTNARIVEYSGFLDCRPCGIHGYQECPKGHFKCSEIAANEIVVQ